MTNDFMMKTISLAVSQMKFRIVVDLGFLGLLHEYENIHLPHKKPRGGELSVTQKEENRTEAQSRVVCENADAGVKRYNAVSGVYRNRIEAFDDHLMLTAAFLMELLLDGCLERSYSKTSTASPAFISRQLYFRKLWTEYAV